MMMASDNKNPIAELSIRFRIPLAILVAFEVRHVSDLQVRELLGINGRTGQDLTGIVFPCRDPRDGRLLGHRVRLDVPVEGQKYLSEERLSRVRGSGCPIDHSRRGTDSYCTPWAQYGLRSIFI